MSIPIKVTLNEKDVINLEMQMYVVTFIIVIIHFRYLQMLKLSAR